MLIETVDLNLANTGLAGLDEISVLRLFATVQARALVEGTGRNLREIENADGVALYPAFYRTRICVPPPHRLEQHKTWERVDIGVEVKRFGTMILESKGALASEGALPRDAATWTPEQHIHFEGSMTFVHDVATGGDFRVDAPREGTVANLSLLSKRPAPIEELRRVRQGGVIDPSRKNPLRGQVRQQMVIGRDVQSRRAAMFSAFTSLFEVGEQTLLVQQLWPALDPELLSDVHVLEREVFYLANVHQGETVCIDTAATIAPAPERYRAAYDGFVAVATLDLFSEIYDASTNALLVAAKTKKIFLAPRTRANSIHHIERLLSRHRDPS